VKIFKIITIVLLLFTNFSNSNNYNCTQTYMGVMPPDISKLKGGLALTLEPVNDNDIKISVTNLSKRALRFYSYSQGHEKGYDNFELEIVTPDNDRVVINFYNFSEKPMLNIVSLKPGESFSHVIDLQYWSRQGSNKSELNGIGLSEVFHGIGKMRVIYRNRPCENYSNYEKSIWTGTIFSDWVVY